MQESMPVDTIIKYEVLIRIPPGDRWIPLTQDSSDREPTPQSMIEALNSVYNRTGQQQFFVDARAGVIYAVKEAPTPEPPKPSTYSLYGE